MQYKKRGKNKTRKKKQNIKSDYLLLPSDESIDFQPALHSMRKKKFDWESKTMIYEILSQFYVHQRSVIFIVDSVFDGIWYQNIANKFIHE